jgi:hypothetical protein
MNKKQIKSDKIINKYLGHEQESSMIENLFFTGYSIFGIILIIFSVVYYFYKISNTFWFGISAFFISLLITILHYFCQRKKICKIRMIFKQ